MSNILIISPHSDDETLGCGGTLLKHKANGDKLFWLIMSCMTVEEGYTQERIKARGYEINQITEVYGFEKVYELDFPTTKLDRLPRGAMIAEVSRIVAQIRPHTVYLPHRGDAHLDHRISHEVVMASIKTFRVPSVRRVLSYETISETEFAEPALQNAFVPNAFSDITEYLDQKIAAMEIYKGELGSHPFPRSKDNIRALALFRGAIAGVNYAESFMIIREIW